MKPEERHELKENSLMIWLQYGLPAFLKKNGSYLLLAAALGLLGYTLWHRHELNVQIAKEKSAQDLIAAESPVAQNRLVKLQSIINDSEVPAIRAIALRDLGNYHLSTVNTGSADLAADSPRVNPEEALSRASDAFNRILKEYPNNALAVGSAKLGLGTVAENKRDWDEARKIYEELAGKGTSIGMAFAAVANSRLASLPVAAKAPQLAVNIPPASTLPATSMPSFLQGPVVIPSPTPAATQGK